MKARILEEISGSKDRIPSDRKVAAFIMRKWKENREQGRFYFHFIFNGGALRSEVPAKFSLKVAGNILIALANHQAIHRVLLEGRLHGQKNVPTKCCLIYGHDTPDGGVGYYIAITSEDDFPRVGYLSLVPKNPAEESIISIITQDGWKDLSLREALEFAEVRMTLTAFQRYLLRGTTIKVDPKKIKMNESLAPPVDPECDRRLHLVLRDTMQLTEAYASLSMIRPFSLEHCFKAPEFNEEIFQQQAPALLTYWHDGKFVMSDDYSSYVTYRKNEVTEARIVIMGDFPEGEARTIKTGTKELLPPIGIGSSHREIDDPDYKEWQLNLHLRRQNRQPLPADEIAQWLGFADLLGNDEVSERDIHNFLIEHPLAISAYGIQIASEVSLGGEFRIDLVIRSKGIQEEVLLIEFEPHQEPIFTSEGRFRHKVTHAKQQVEDWFRWLAQHPDNALAKDLGGLLPRGLVVIGKSRELSAEDRSRLAHLNQNSRIQVITYDELLDRFSELILERCEDSQVT